MFGTGDLSDSMALLSCKNPYFDWLRVKPVTAEASKGTQCVMVMLDYVSSYIMMEGLRDWMAGKMV